MNSNVFIFLFLPVILALYLIFPFRGVALVFSILFYLWLDPLYFPIILFIAVLIYFAARLLHKRPGRILILISVGLNILILFFFKSLEADLLDPI